MSNRALLAGALVLAALAATPFVRGSDTKDSPPGIAPENWIPLNDKIGVVISVGIPMHSGIAPVDPQGRPRVMVLGQPVAGYFMVEVEPSVWARVEIVAPARAHSAGATG